MLALTQQRCFNHGTREATVRCPECKRFFCRECVTEHRGRMLCAACLALTTRAKVRQSRSWLRALLLRPIQITLSVFLLWLLFYGMGQGLLRIPDEFARKSLPANTNWDDNS